LPKSSWRKLDARASKSLWRALAKITILVLLIIAANLAADWVVDAFKLELRPSNEDSAHKAILTTAVVYALLIAIPFVPGVEIGLALISMVGPGILFLVYLSTIAGLSISFLIGRFVALSGLINLLEGLQFSRVGQLLRKIEPMNRQDRLEFLVSKAPNRYVPFLLRHRYIALAIALNLPGNILIGGGGGLALMAGVSRLYSVPVFLVTIALAVSPVPFVILFFSNEILPG